MTKFNKLPRRLLLLAVLLASLFVAADTGTRASECPYGPDCGYEPNNCELRCFEQYDVCMSGTATWNVCADQRYRCLVIRCGW